MFTNLGINIEKLMQALTILIVEDNEADYELIKIYLEEVSFNCRLLHTDSLYGAFKIVDSEHIDLALLDLSLIDSFGFNTLRNFAEKAPHIAVIVLTGMNNEIMGMQSVRAGAQDYLVKGEFDNKGLVKSIRYGMQRFKAQVRLQEAAEELARIEKRFSDAEELAKMGNWEMDIVSNKMTWSQQVYRIFGMEPQSIEPSLTDYLRFVHIEDKERVTRFFDQVVKEGALQRIKHRCSLDLRTVKYLELQAKVNFNGASNRILLIGSVQDITERENMPHNKLNSQDYRIPVVWRQKLLEHSFEGLAQLSKIYQSPQELNNRKAKLSFSVLQEIFLELQRLSIISSVGLSKDKEKISVTDLVNELRQFNEPFLVSNQMQLKLTGAKNFPAEVYCQKDLMLVLLANLIYLVVQKSAPQSTLDLIYSLHSDSQGMGFFEVVFRYNGKKLSFEQISEESWLTAIETSGSSTSAEKQCFAAIWKLIRHFNFEITPMEPESGLKRFMLSIPLGYIRKENINTGEWDDPKKILVMEDHSMSQHAIKRSLQNISEHYQVDIAENGKKGVEMLDRHQYDIALVDLQMPVMDGFEVMKTLGKTIGFPVIALTSKETPEEETQCLSLGFKGYLSKPIKEDILRGVLQKTWKN